MNRFCRSLAATLGFALVHVTCAMAQSNYPNRPITVVTPVTPGISADVLVRLLAERLKDALGKPIIVENAPGAGSAIAAGTVARAPADGHTILLNGSITQVSNYLRAKEAKFDPIESFTPLIYMGDTPYALVVRGAFPANTLKEYIDYARANPGQVTFGSTGPANPTAVALAQLKRARNLDIRYIPYRNSSTLQLDVAGGNLDSGMFAVGGTGFANGKDAKIIAACNEERCVSLPQMPTFKEQGFDCPICGAAALGMWMRAGTPPEIVAKMNSAINAIIKDPLFAAEALKKTGWTMRGGPPQAWADILAREKKTFEEVQSTLFNGGQEAAP